jgi:integrase
VSELVFDYNSVAWNEGFVNVWDEKKDRYRKIYVPESVLDALWRYWNGKLDRKDPRFFEMSAKTIERVIQGWTGEVLSRPKSWHCVRHTYITQSFESSIPISIVIENTGDKPATILQYYTKLSPTFIKEQINEKPLFNPV